MTRNLWPLPALVLLSGCEVAMPMQPDALGAGLAFARGGDVLIERAWSGGQQFEFVKPRPPGIGADDGTRMNVYQIAPVDPADPLSPPLHIPDVISVAGRDHVLHAPRGSEGDFTGVGRTVPVLVPGWRPHPPFDAIACSLPDIGDLATRIAWQWSDPTPHPCGRAPVVFGARLAGDECVRPLTTVARIEAAALAGLVELAFPPEPAWPFAIRPITRAGAGRTTVVAPQCVPAGQRM